MGFYLQYFTDSNYGTLITDRVKEARPLNRGSTGYQVGLHLNGDFLLLFSVRPWGNNGVFQWLLF